MLRVRELVEGVTGLPDQEAAVLIGEGTDPNVWPPVMGVRSVSARCGLFTARSQRWLRNCLTMAVRSEREQRR